MYALNGRAFLWLAVVSAAATTVVGIFLDHHVPFLLQPHAVVFLVLLALLSLGDVEYAAVVALPIGLYHYLVSSALAATGIFNFAPVYIKIAFFCYVLLSALAMVCVYVGVALLAVGRRPKAVVSEC